MYQVRYLGRVRRARRKRAIEARDLSWSSRRVEQRMQVAGKRETERRVRIWRSVFVVLGVRESMERWGFTLR